MFPFAIIQPMAQSQYKHSMSFKQQLSILAHQEDILRENKEHLHQTGSFTTSTQAQLTPLQHQVPTIDTHEESTPATRSCCAPTPATSTPRKTASLQKR
ncbi:hypothetical protein BDF14DRAFT_1800388 [Spinellus fusiger]|nr:hypothetical protein BDF14DRAFT_1800388 [Spinellus fusiger]